MSELSVMELAAREARTGLEGLIGAIAGAMPLSENEKAELCLLGESIREVVDADHCAADGEMLKELVCGLSASARSDMLMLLVLDSVDSPNMEFAVTVARQWGAEYAKRLAKFAEVAAVVAGVLKS